MIGRLTLTLLAAAASSPPGDLAPIHGPYHPSIDPANFVRTIDNAFLPYSPGMRIRFKGVRGTTPQVDQELVLHRTVRILGLTCTVVRDTVSEHGRAIELTDDFYAQDRQGNVWYMGEDSFERNKAGRFVKASDSWRGGVNGGKPGIIMPADPKVGDAYRQEYYPPGKALDEARVLRRGARLTVPLRSFRHVLVTSEFSPAEPQTERKYYAPGVGEIAEHVVKGHHEAFKLVSLKR
ncbi:MAG: YjbF family lipoprotein [Actinobacteria bacterium]|nr:MAG: YjbF family lipoprotein [Actinomycetota bacterium]